jgi:hypothetical protein
MKKTFFALLLAVSCAIALAQPKIAVLDALIPQNMDPSIISPATDKIIEKLVQSNRFIVLDRANIDSVLKEREFQVSGMVSDQDAVTAGKYLGADFIVVSKISRVGDTNFISGKMINVKTGVIVSTTSAQGDGKLPIVISLAGQVGEVLAGGTATPVVEPRAAAVTPPPAEQPAPQEAPTQTQVAQPSSGSPFTDSFIGFGFFLNNDTWKEEDTSGSYSYTNTWKYKLGTAQVQFIPSKYIQFGIGMSWFRSGTFEEENTSTGYSASGDILKDGSMTWLDVNFLFRIPIRFSQTGVALVPLVGFEYDIILSYKDADGNDLTKNMTSDEKSDLSRFYFQIGAGLQINAGSLVIYPEVLYGFKFKSKVDEDTETTATTTNNWSDSSVSEGKLDFGLVIGFKI